VSFSRRVVAVGEEERWMPVVVVRGVPTFVRGFRRRVRYAPNWAVALCVELSSSGLEGAPPGVTRTGAGGLVLRWRMTRVAR
jgi:hypothetical protein